MLNKKERAFELRREGRSLGFIAEQLKVSKSSVSLWCKDILLTAEQQDRLEKNQINARLKGQLIGAEINKRKKIEVIEFYKKQGVERIGLITKRDLLVIGTSLYWAEGSKKDGKLAFVNSDPFMILLMCRWFREIQKVSKEDFMPRIFINEMHRPRAAKILSFWSKLLKLPMTQFGNITFLKMRQKKTYSNYDKYYGILSLRVRNSSRLKYQLLGLINGVVENFKLSG